MVVDAHLTTLANVIEEQLEMGDLGYTLGSDINRLIRLARDAAALQPDGSRVPRQRCGFVHARLLALVDPSVSNRLSTITLTYARRIARLVEEKVCGCICWGGRGEGGTRCEGKRVIQGFSRGAVTGVSSTVGPFLSLPHIPPNANPTYPPLPTPYHSLCSWTSCLSLLPTSSQAVSLSKAATITTVAALAPARPSPSSRAGRSTSSRF